MFRVDDPTAVASPPAVPAPTGSTPGYFTNGDPVSGQAATLVPDWWLTQVQEELLGILVAAGIVPAKGSNAQVIAALLQLFGGGGAIGGNGWQKLPGSLILQWGSGSSGPNGQTVVDFGTVFPNACFVVMATEQNATGWSNPSQTKGSPTVHGVTSKSTGSFTMETYSWNATADLWAGSSGVAYGYIALGN